MLGLSRALPPHEILGGAEAERIHEDALAVLERTGVVMQHRGARRLLSDAGCSVDDAAERVRFPHALVTDALKRVPSEFVVRARERTQDITIGKPDVLLLFSGGGMRWVDLDNWQPRLATRREFYDYVRILDALPTVHALGAAPVFGFEGIPDSMALIESCAAKIRFSTKAQAEGCMQGEDRFTIAMARAVGADLLCYVSPTSPLTYDAATLENLMRWVAEGVPFEVTPGPLAGMSAPVTIADALVLNNAEALAGIVLAEVLRPGHPVWTGCMLFVQNMRNGQPWFGSTTNSLITAAWAQVWRGHGIATSANSASWTDSKMLDFQAGSDIASAAYLSALSGVSAINLHGGFCQQMSAHPIKAILDDDLASGLGAFLSGVTVNEETSVVGLIDEVGPAPGNYLSHGHTRRHWREARAFPHVAELTSFAAWHQQPPVGTVDLAKKRMELLLVDHGPKRLTTSQEEAIEDILNEARAHYRKHGLISDEEWRLYQKDLASSEYPVA